MEADKKSQNGEYFNKNGFYKKQKKRATSVHFS